MSFQQGLSGLNATSKNLEVIGNNIANANTYGSKVARAEFSDMYAASLNGAGSNEVGIGTTPVSYTHLDVYKRQARASGDDLHGLS